MKSVLKLINNSKGFSLTEIMVGGGILAGVALASAQLFKDQKLAQRKIEYDQKLAIYHNNLSKLITLPENCNSTLKMVIPNGSGISATTVPRLYTCTSGCKDLNTTANLDYHAYSTNAYQGTVLINAGDFIDNTKTWKLKSMRILDARANSGTTRLRISYELAVNNMAPKTINKDVFLNVRFDGGAFRECLGAQESNINNLQSDLCKSLNVGGLDSTGALARWDEPTQTCVVDGSRSCGANEEAIISSTGLIKCRPIVKAGDAAALQGSGTANCTNPIVEFVNNKVSVRCGP